MKRKISFSTIAQSIYLSIKFFINNNLATYASACALGFLFSFIPILMLIVTVLVQFLHASPKTIFEYIDLQSIFIDPDKIENITENLLTTNNTGIFAIILLISIFWMSQRFFFSITTGIKTIFHINTIKRRPLLESLFTMLGEIILVICIAILLLIVMSVSSVLSENSLLNKMMITYLPNTISVFLGNLSNQLFSLLPFIFIFIVSTIILRLLSGSKPKLKLCTLGALFCTIIFWGVTKFLSLFINIARYNLIYGVLSNLIIMLLEVYIFFVLFFFTAQYLFTIQFFDSLLLSELYLLPSIDQYSMYALIKRALFIRPDKLISDENMHLQVKKDDIIYCEGNKSNGIFYVLKGSVKLSKENYLTYIENLSFFGDIDCILEQPRTMNAKAATDSVLIFISNDDFRNILESNPEVSKQLLDNLPEYIYRVYGRK